MPDVKLGTLSIENCMFGSLQVESLYFGDTLVWTSVSDCTITIVPTPSDATVTLTASGYTQEGNSITVRSNTVVTIDVSKTGYTPYHNEYRVTGTETIPVSLDAIMCEVTVNTTPADATVHFSTGTVEGHTCTVPYGTTLLYWASKTGYVSSSTTTVVVTQSFVTSIPELVKENYTITINPTPADATVVLTATGYTQQGNTITVPFETPVTYTVSKQNYTTVSNTISATSTETLNVTLVQNGFTLTIVPTPSDATVTLLADGYTQQGNTITVPNNTSVQWTVSKMGYITQSNTILMHQDETMNIELVSGACIFTVVPVPSDCNVTVMDLEAGQMTSGIGEKSLNTTIGNTVRCIVSKSGYTTKTVDVPVTGTTRMTITLEATMATITLITNAPNPTIVLSSPGYTQDGNSITVPFGTRVDYIVSAPGYVTRQSTIFADTDKTYEILLTEDSNAATITIAPTPTSTDVTITCEGYGSVSGKGTQSLTVPKGSPVTYKVTYGSQTLEVKSTKPFYVASDVLIEYDMTKQHVEVDVQYNNQSGTDHLIGMFIYRSTEGTMVVGPVDASVSVPLFFPKNEQIMLTFHTPTGSYSSGSTATYSKQGGISYGLRINKILTVNYSPSDALVNVVDGAGNLLPPITESAGKNTYYFPYYHSQATEFYSNTSTITVSKPGYVSKSVTATRQYASDGSVTVNLSPES